MDKKIADYWFSVVDYCASTHEIDENDKYYTEMKDAINKQIFKEPIVEIIHSNNPNSESAYWLVCPSCKAELKEMRYNWNYCPYCGQKVYEDKTIIIEN